MKTKLATLTALALTTVTASAHPGHPGHDFWPFEDVKMAAIGVAVAIAMGLVVARLLAQKH